MKRKLAKTIALRKEGFSYSEIMKRTGVPKSTLSNWLSKEKWSKKVRDELSTNAKLQSTSRMVALNLKRGIELRKLYEQAEQEAHDEYNSIKFHPLFLIGISLFWGEGNRASKHKVRLGNTDPEMLTSFKNFLTHICGVPESALKAELLVYPDLNPDETVDFWCNKIPLPKENFISCTHIQGKHKTRKSKYGICMLYVSNAYLKRKIDTWLMLIRKEKWHDVLGSSENAGIV